MAESTSLIVWHNRNEVMTPEECGWIDVSCLKKCHLGICLAPEDHYLETAFH